MPPNAARTVFVANIPYEVSEEQLANVFSEVGPVANVEIKFDPQTGRSKGYAFVQYHDSDTSLSAVRNLHEVLVNGRNLRVELSTEEPGPGPRRRGRGGGGGGGGRGNDRDSSDRSGPPGPPPGVGPGPGPMGPPGGYGGPMPMGGGMPDQGGPPVDLNLLPPGQDLPMGQKATDAISKTLAAISPGEIQDVMSGMKTLIATQPERARELLHSKPQLAYALFQAMLLMNIIDPSVLQRITPLPAPNAPQQYPPPSNYPPYPAQAQAPPPNYPLAQPPQQQYRPPQQGYGGPPPPAPLAAGPAILPAAQASLTALPDDQRAMVMQVLQLTPDQINALDVSQRDSVVQLRRQFLGTA